MPKKEARDTYKYWFKVGNVKCTCGVTKNLRRTEREHQNSGRYTTRDGKRFYWRDGHIGQSGNMTTRSAALEWKRKNK